MSRHNPSRASQLFAPEQPFDPAGTAAAVAVIDRRREHVAKHGHTPAADRELPIEKLPENVNTYSGDTLFCLQGARNPKRLHMARIYMINAGAMAIAAADRIEHEIACIEAQQAIETDFSAAELGDGEHGSKAA